MLGRGPGLFYVLCLFLVTSGLFVFGNLGGFVVVLMRLLLVLLIRGLFGLGTTTLPFLIKARPRASLICVVVTAVVGVVVIAVFPAS